MKIGVSVSTVVSLIIGEGGNPSQPPAVIYLFSDDALTMNYFADDALALRYRVA